MFMTFCLTGESNVQTEMHKQAPAERDELYNFCHKKKKIVGVSRSQSQQHNSSVLRLVHGWAAGSVANRVGCGL